MKCGNCEGCLSKKCHVCINCMPTWDGRRKHKKCLRKVCENEKKSILPTLIEKEKVNSSAKKDLKKIASTIKLDKSNILKAKICANPQKEAKELSYIIA